MHKNWSFQTAISFLLKWRYLSKNLTLGQQKGNEYFLLDLWDNWGHHCNIGGTGRRLFPNLPKMIVLQKMLSHQVSLPMGISAWAASQILGPVVPGVTPKGQLEPFFWEEAQQYVLLRLTCYARMSLLPLRQLECTGFPSLKLCR